jgi:hypothetical protein
VGARKGGDKEQTQIKYLNKSDGSGDSRVTPVQLSSASKALFSIKERAHHQQARRPLGCM